MRKITVPGEIQGLPIIASMSGGKDSTALALALMEAGIPFRAVFADTGWESNETYAYLDYLREKLGITVDVVGTAGLPAKAAGGRGFPTRLARWCTLELKIEPLKAYHRALGEDTVSAVGIRSDESISRSQMPELEDSPEQQGSWGGWVWRPLINWTVADVLNMHSRSGIHVNPLYTKGHNRVGCYPCIFSNKEEIKLIADNDPARIDQIEALEESISKERVRLNLLHEPTPARPNRYKNERATFFTGSAGSIRGIREVVAWSRTSHGGKQVPLLAEPPRGGCMRWGLCDTGLPDYTGPSTTCTMTSE